MNPYTPEAWRTSLRSLIAVAFGACQLVSTAAPAGDIMMDSNHCHAFWNKIYERMLLIQEQFKIKPTKGERNGITIEESGQRPSMVGNAENCKSGLLVYPGPLLEIWSSSLLTSPTCKCHKYNRGEVKIEIKKMDR